MIGGLSTIAIMLMCFYTLRVHAGCPAGFDLNSFAKNLEAQKANNKTDAEILEEKLRSVIPLTDTDSDNKTSVEELAAFTQKTLKKVHDEEAKFRLEILDKNKDNKVSWEEYLQSKENIGASTEEQKKRRFNHADEDKDGQLSQDEIISMFHPEERSHMYDVVIDEYMETGDSNKDGLMTLEEYKAKVQKTGKSDVEAAQKFFKMLDKDEDGKISRDEIKEWLTSLNTASQAKKQSQQLMDMVDDDKDGLLVEEEVLNHKDLFSEDKQKSKKKAKDKSKKKADKKSKDEL